MNTEGKFAPQTTLLIRSLLAGDVNLPILQLKLVI